jgi:hypothetical protein
MGPHEAGSGATPVRGILAENPRKNKIPGNWVVVQFGFKRS